MLEIRRDEDIHHADGAWFRARWHFSFDAYRDPHWNGVGPLRVFNHDELAPGAIWPMHPHADIEGITYVWKAPSATPTASGTAACSIPAPSR